MKHPRGTAFERLPQIATAVFCLATIWVLFHDLLPAFRENQLAEELYAHQQERYERLVEDLRAKRREVRSLETDPQARERILDARGLLPAPKQADGQGAEATKR